MKCEIAWLLAAVAAAAFGQQPHATIRVEVTAESLPIQGADVTVNSKPALTGQDGSATVAAALGDTKITVTRDGFFPANVSLLTDTAREWVVRVELEPRKALPIS